MNGNNRHRPRIAPGTKPRAHLSASEAVHAFVSWITTLDHPEPAGAQFSTPKWLEMAQLFCASQNLKEPQNGWPDRMIPMNRKVKVEPANLYHNGEFEQLQVDDFPGSNHTIMGREYTEQEKAVAINEKIPDVSAFSDGSRILTKHVALSPKAREHFLRTGEIWVMELGETSTPKALLIGEPLQITVKVEEKLKSV